VLPVKSGIACNGQTLCNCVSTCFGHDYIVHWSSSAAFLAPVTSLCVQALLVASYRFGDTVHPPVNCDCLVCPVSYLIHTDTVIVQWLSCLPRSRSSGVLLHSGPSEIFASTVKGLVCSYVQLLSRSSTFVLPPRQVFELLSISTSTEPFKKGGHIVGHWTCQAFRLENESFSVQSAGHHGQGLCVQ
jgi:hypothetical protein